MDVPLETLESFLLDLASEKFKKEKKAGKKMIDEIAQDVASVNNVIDEIAKRLDPEKDDLLTRAATRFVDALRGELKKATFPAGDKVTHADLKGMFDFLSKMFTAYNENGRKWFPKIGKEFKAELKSLDLFMNKLFRNNGKLDHFIRTKYDKAKEAEDLADKIKKLDELRLKVIEDRKKIDELSTRLEQLNADLAGKEEQLVGLENDPMVVEERSLFREQNGVKQQIQLELGKIKKSMKKFLKAVDMDEITPRFITAKEVKEYFKNPFESLIADGPEHPKLRAILENLEGGLDEEIQLKEDKKTKTQETISAMKDEQSLKPLIERYQDLETRRKEMQRAIAGKGADEKMATIKHGISDMTTQRGHVEADIQHEKENVMNTLNKMKAAKEALEKEIESVARDRISIMLAL